MIWRPVILALGVLPFVLSGCSGPPTAASWRAAAGLSLGPRPFYEPHEHLDALSAQVSVRRLPLSPEGIVVGAQFRLALDFRRRSRKLFEARMENFFTEPPGHFLEKETVQELLRVRSWATRPFFPAPSPEEVQPETIGFDEHGSLSVLSLPDPVTRFVSGEHRNRWLALDPDGLPHTYQYEDERHGYQVRYVWKNADLSGLSRSELLGLTETRRELETGQTHSVAFKLRYTNVDGLSLPELITLTIHSSPSVLPDGSPASPSRTSGQGPRTYLLLFRNYQLEHRSSKEPRRLLGPEEEVLLETAARIDWPFHHARRIRCKVDMNTSQPQFLEEFPRDVTLRAEFVATIDFDPKTGEPSVQFSLGKLWTDPEGYRTPPGLRRRVEEAVRITEKIFLPVEEGMRCFYRRVEKTEIDRGMLKYTLGKDPASDPREADVSRRTLWVAADKTVRQYISEGKEGKKRISCFWEPTDTGHLRLKSFQMIREISAPFGQTLTGAASWDIEYLTMGDASLPSTATVQMSPPGSPAFVERYVFRDYELER